MTSTPSPTRDDADDTDDTDDADDTGAPPVVVAIHLAPGRRLPVEAVEHARAETGHGLVGDRYEDARHRHLTVQSAADLAAASADWGGTVEPGATRRNLTVSHGQIPTRPGTRARVGGLELEVVRVAAPCRIMDDTVGPGAHLALRRRGGTVFRVLSGGEVRLGDTFTTLPADS